MPEFPTFDQLTGLPSYRAVVQTLGEMAASGALSGVMLLDVDRFGLLNNAEGHGRADEALLAVARVLRRPGLWPGRLGGNQFAVLFTCEDVDQESFRLWRAVSEVLLEFETPEVMRLSSSLGWPSTAGRVLSVSAVTGTSIHCEPPHVLETLSSVLKRQKVNGRGRLLTL